MLAPWVGIDRAARAARRYGKTPRIRIALATRSTAMHQAAVRNEVFSARARSATRSPAGMIFSRNFWLTVSSLQLSPSRPYTHSK